MLKFDEINKLEYDEQKVVSVLMDYFDKMDIDDERKYERVQMGKEIFNMTLLIFVLIANLPDQTSDIDYYVETFTLQYLNIAERYVPVDAYIENYIRQVSREIINNTFDSKSDYELSEERIFAIAENEPNTVLNYKDFEKAINNGFTQKQWITEKDNRVRRTHRQVDDRIIPINQPFEVGDSLMNFPHDRSLNADDREIIGCRCSVKYIR